MRLIKNTIKNSGLVAVIACAMLVVGGGSAIAGSMITGKQVKNSTLTGVDIKNKSINAGDLTDAARNTLKGNVGATGATGSYSPMGSAFSSVQSTNGTATPEPVFTDVPVNVPTGSSKLLIHFNAECSVTDPAQYATQYVSIRVDGVQIQNSASICANTPDFDTARFSSNSVQRYVDVAPGAHTVSVTHWVSDATATGYLDDKTLTIIPAA
ncbi:MAG: hypothetical protein JHC98_12480 [Thermoleophilaceae bacterium]|nr:hypothetical protein [Thermoleophilaceae bacterium]